MNISDEVVEAAARAGYKVAVFADETASWDDLSEDQCQVWIDDARHILEAVAPHLMAQAWDEGADAEFQRSVMKRQRDANPYRQ